MNDCTEKVRRFLYDLQQSIAITRINDFKSVAGLYNALVPEISHLLDITRPSEQSFDLEKWIEDNTELSDKNGNRLINADSIRLLYKNKIIL